MSSREQHTLRKAEIKVALEGWREMEAGEMSFEIALQKVGQYVDDLKDSTPIVGVKVSRFGRQWQWVEEFSGDADFNYIGVEI